MIRKLSRYILITTLAVLVSASSPRTPENRQPTPGAVTNPDVLVTQDLSTGLTLQDVIAALVGTSSINISNISFNGSDSALGTFSGGTGIIGFEQGIILSSGLVQNVIGPNTADGDGHAHGLPGDADLDSLIPGFETEDACILEFDFECAAVNQIGFEYVFASEEYNEYVNNDFNDVFGFFVNGKNVALLPDGQTVVSINNVNGGNPLGDSASNPQYFINNDECQFSTVPSCPLNTEMDGLTVVLVARAKIQPGVNHIKLAIADAGDGILDSDVFIKGQSFVCGAVNNNTPTCAINPSGPFNLEVGGNLTFTVTGSDPDDGQAIYLYSLGNLPPGATMTPSLPRAGSRTGLSSQFSWTPTQAGDYTAAYFVTDSLGGADTNSVRIIVTAPEINLPPVALISPPGPYTIPTGSNLSFVVSGTDPNDGQTIQLSAFGTLPPGAIMNPPLPVTGPDDGVTSLFSWTPTLPGVYVARFILTDNQGQADTVSTQITVVEGNPPRVVSTSPPDNAVEVIWDARVLIQFSERINANQLTSSFQALSSRHGSMAINIGLLNDSLVAISPQQHPWPDDGEVTIRVLGSLADLAGNTLDGNTNGISEGVIVDDYVFSFQTAPGVYSGDANDDGIVDERDILPLGVHYLRTGPQRFSNSNIWSLEFAQPWVPREATHADCDGNGIIDSLDICPILEFFDREVPAKTGTTIYSNVAAGLDPNVRTALARALLECDNGSLAVRAALIEALGGTTESNQPVPSGFRMHQNYPNPFNAGTVIEWQLDSESIVDLTVYDILGRRVRTLVNQLFPAGTFRVSWDAKDNAGNPAASGVYVYRLAAGTQSQSKSMILLR